MLYAFNVGCEVIYLSSNCGRYLRCSHWN